MNKYLFIAISLLILSTTSSAVQPLFSGYPTDHEFFAINLGFMFPEQRARDFIDGYYRPALPMPADWPLQDEETESESEESNSALEGQLPEAEKDVAQPVASPETQGKRKTVICKWWKMRNCARGENCDFAHGVNDLAPDAAAAIPVCRYYERNNGHCMYGSHCNFRHPPKDRHSDDSQDSKDKG